MRVGIAVEINMGFPPWVLGFSCLGRYSGPFFVPRGGKKIQRIRLERSDELPVIVRVKPGEQPTSRVGYRDGVPWLADPEILRSHNSRFEGIGLNAEIRVGYSVGIPGDVVGHVRKPP